MPVLECPSQRDPVCHLLIAAIHRKIHAVLWGEFLGDIRIPVRIRIIRVCAVFIQFQLLVTVDSRSPVQHFYFILDGCEGIGIRHIGDPCVLLKTGVVCKVEGRFSRFSAFCLHQYHPVGGTCPVDGSRGIFQYGYILNIVWIESFQTIPRNPVNNDQGCIVPQCIFSADKDSRIIQSRFTASCVNSHTRHRSG